LLTIGICIFCRLRNKSFLYIEILFSILPPNQSFEFRAIPANNNVAKTIHIII